MKLSKKLSIVLLASIALNTASTLVAKSYTKAALTGARALVSSLSTITGAYKITRCIASPDVAINKLIPLLRKYEQRKYLKQTLTNQELNQIAKGSVVIGSLKIAIDSLVNSYAAIELFKKTKQHLSTNNTHTQETLAQPDAEKKARRFKRLSYLAGANILFRLVYGNTATQIAKPKNEEFAVFALDFLANLSTYCLLQEKARAYAAQAQKIAQTTVQEENIDHLENTNEIK